MKDAGICDKALHWLTFGRNQDDDLWAHKAMSTATLHSHETNTKVNAVITKSSGKPLSGIWIKWYANQKTWSRAAISLLYKFHWFRKQPSSPPGTHDQLM